MKPPGIPSTSPLMSVVIPFYKTMEIIPYLQNILNFHSQLEIILVHDIHFGESSEILRSFLQEMDFINVILVEGDFGNPGAARNAGLFLANSSWVTFWDSDDIPDPKIYINELLLRLTKNLNFDAIIFDFETRNLTSKKSRVFRSNGELFYGVGINPGIWRIIFRKDLIGSSVFECLRMGEDQIFISECIGKVSSLERIHFSSEIAYVYIRHDQGQLTSLKWVVSELPSATGVLFDFAVNSQFPIRQKLSQIMFVRQILTNFKVGGFRTKFQAISLYHKLNKTLSARLQFKLLIQNLQIARKLIFKEN